MDNSIMKGGNCNPVCVPRVSHARCDCVTISHSQSITLRVPAFLAYTVYTYTDTYSSDGQTLFLTQPCGTVFSRWPELPPRFWGNAPSCLSAPSAK